MDCLLCSNGIFHGITYCSFLDEIYDERFGNMIFFATAMMIASALLLMFMGVVGFLQRRLSSVVFFATAGYAIIALATTEQLISQFDVDTYFQMADIYVVGSIVLSSAVLVISKFVAKDSLSPPVWELPDFQGHAVLAAALALTSLVLIVIARGGDISMNWSEARVSNGFLSALGTTLFMLACPGVVSAFYTRRVILGALLLLLCLGLFVVIGSRAAFLGTLLFAIWLMLTRASSAGAQVKILALGLTMTFIVHTILRTLRGYGIAGLLQAYDEGDLLAVVLPDEEGVDVSGGEANMPKYLMFSITQSSIADFGFMTSIQRLFLLPIPSIKGWIDKPLDVTNMLWKNAFEDGLLSGGQGQAILAESYMTDNYGSLHPIIFGEYFLAGGWISLVLSTVVLGAVLVAIDYFMHRTDRLTSLVLCGPVLVGYLFVARGNSVVGLGYFIYLSVLLGLLRYLAIKMKGVYTLVTANYANTPTEPEMKK
jgi:hypothetical protein